MRQAAKEAFENNTGHYLSSKTITRAFLGRQECFAQEAVYHILPKLQLRRVFPVQQCNLSIQICLQKD